MTSVALQVVIDSLTYATCSGAWRPLAVFPFEHQFVGDRLVLRDCVLEFYSWIFGLKQELRNKNKFKILQEDSPSRSKELTPPEECLREKENIKERNYNREL